MTEKVYLLFHFSVKSPFSDNTCYLTIYEVIYFLTKKLRIFFFEINLISNLNKLDEVVISDLKDFLFHFSLKQFKIMTSDKKLIEDAIRRGIIGGTSGAMAMTVQVIFLRYIS